MSYNKSMGFSSKSVFSQSAMWSQDSRVAICTEDGINILEPQLNVPMTRGYKSGKMSGLNLKISKIDTCKEINEFDISIDREHLQKSILKKSDMASEIFHLMLDRTLSPSIQSMQSFRSYKIARWSPLGGDVIGRCILGTLSLDHRLCIFSQMASQKGWDKVVELSKIMNDQVIKDGHKIAGERIKKQKGGIKEMNLLQQRTHILAATGFDWSPYYSYGTGEEPASKKKKLSETSKEKNQGFSYLAVAVRSGHLVLWRISMPLLSSEDCEISQIIEMADDSPTAIQWCSVDETTSFVTVGFHSGFVKAVVVRRQDSGMSYGEVCDLWKDKDHIPVTALCWDTQERVLYCGKAVFLFTFEVQVKQKSAEVAVIRSNHTMVAPSQHINGLWASHPYVYVGLQSGKVFSVTTSRKQGLKLEQEAVTLPHEGEDWRSHGISVSPSRVYLAALESPSAHYCHLSVREPLNIHLVSLQSPGEIAASLLHRGECKLADVADALVFIRQVYQQEDSLPQALEALMSKVEDCSSMSSYELKLSRWMISLKLAAGCRAKDGNPREKDTETLCSQLEVIEKLLVGRHVSDCLENVRGSDVHAGTLTQQERCSLMLMCDWAVNNKDIMHSNKNFDTVIKEVRDKIGKQPESSSRETCIICKKVISFSHHNQSSCAQGHQFSRCSLTLLMCQDSFYRRCTICNSHSIPKPSQGFDWLSSKVHINHCMFCDGKLV